MTNFSEIGQEIAKISRLFDFSRWRPSAILDLFATFLDTMKHIWWSSLVCKIWLESVQ